MSLSIIKPRNPARAELQLFDERRLTIILAPVIMISLIIVTLRHQQSSAHFLAVYTANLRSSQEFVLQMESGTYPNSLWSMSLVSSFLLDTLSKLVNVPHPF